MNELIRSDAGVLHVDPVIARPGSLLTTSPYLFQNNAGTPGDIAQVGLNIKLRAYEYFRGCSLIKIDQCHPVCVFRLSHLWTRTEHRAI